MGKLQRDRGIRFERLCASRFREAGLQCRRILEYDGTSHGVDLELSLGGEVLPIAIQCKATKNAADSLKGLKQAFAGRPNWPFALSLHLSRRLLRILICVRGGEPRKVPDWDALFSLLHYIFQAEPSATPAGDFCLSPLSTLTLPAQPASEVCAPTAIQPMCASAVTEGNSNV